MTVDDFLNNDTTTNFVDRITAFLNISTDKLKIVGIKEVSSGRRELADSLPSGIEV